MTFPSSAVCAEPASVDDLLLGWNGTEDLWVFAYGSLIWRPNFNWTERRLATVRGYHRSLCLWSHDHRGSPDLPGLVFGLDRGGCCRGVAYRIAAVDVVPTFRMLWAREMLRGAYVPRWLSCETDASAVRGLVFLLNRRCDDYARGISDDLLLDSVRRAVGQSGRCLDYVVQTEQALRESGIDDGRLGALVRRLVQAAG
ncbi:gamma-glutamylcyclotransferase [Bordetella hinzii]|uniref:gamma-glutamylcyclotransferase n=1 Tax=Bordetella hinzii TaxID=103855 RepID=UPI00114F61D9|nr:gamma-glutamylcyclotransferase [Bordetella hinzii]QDJ37442.1 gamma-glutamylcyclotransferase [Bordetella hinzii]